MIIVQDFSLRGCFQTNVHLEQNDNSIFKNINNDLIIIKLIHIDDRIKKILMKFRNYITYDHIIKYPKLGNLTIQLIQQADGSPSQITSENVTYDTFPEYILNGKFHEYSRANIYNKLVCNEIKYDDIYNIFEIDHNLSLGDNCDQIIPKSRKIQIECVECDTPTIVNIKNIIKNPLFICKSCRKANRKCSTLIVKNLKTILK
jgi:hypothetical protein